MNLTVTGTNFIVGSVVQWNGASRTTNYVSSTGLTASILASDIPSAGTAQVTVLNPTPGGGTSNALLFTISPLLPNTVPVLSSLSPATTVALGSGFTLTVTGTSFVSGSVVQWNGASRPTTFVSSTQLTAAISTSDIASAGTAQVRVFSPTPGGGTSNALSFSITILLPAITSLSPPSVPAGGTAFTLTVTGTKFVSGSIVQWNGLARPTTFLSSNQLTASISASDIASVGTAQVTVFSPTPGGGTSNTRSFNITVPLPALISLSPPSVPVGGPDFTLTVTGMNFVSGSIVQWNGASRPTIFVSSPQLTATIFASDITILGTLQVTVFNPAAGGGVSNALTFTINPPPAVNSAGIVNGASFAAGAPVAPGSIISIFGSNLAASVVPAISTPAYGTALCLRHDQRRRHPAVLRQSCSNQCPGSVRDSRRNSDSGCHRKWGIEPAC